MQLIINRMDVLFDELRTDYERDFQSQMSCESFLGLVFKAAGENDLEAREAREVIDAIINKGE